MTTLPTTTRPRQATPDAPTLDARVEALTRLGRSIYSDGEPRADITIYGTALAHPGLKADQVIGLVKAVGIAACNHNRTALRQSLYRLLRGPGAFPCAQCAANAFPTVAQMPSADACAIHVPAAPKAAR